ncbi:MAG: hypothetical protein ACRDXX_01260 [Stackebrandtia sp.]
MAALADESGRRVVVAADVGTADQHQIAVSNLLDFIADWQPDEVRILTDAACDIGRDSCDATHCPDMTPEPEALTSALRDLRRRYSGPVNLRTPGALAIATGDCLPCCGLPVKALRSLDVSCRIEATRQGRPWQSAYLNVCHIQSGYAGQVALGLARLLDQPTIVGGTGRMGIASNHNGTDKSSALWGMEVGTMRTLEPGQTADRRTTGFALINGSTPHMVPADARGAFTALGRYYGS